ncbi:hypothetical protein SAMN05192588_1558 [Nonlabens sp. Hel1_33_55]|uniref:HYC_CC_PP family protein n=1 Tax=Nonlabens sp. Hel1_33_55 TaxID=1336802 RepID=UPI000875BD26|nr:hypothetical protein [Nonlabens sp. Hel1_33_55]SCY18426.1 hypothetical protein SAMN05192588_1558 [Nonlabens sp. Hel1_33_55]
MKQLIHKSMAILMACVVLMTTMSFTVDMHYCGDTLVDFSFIQSAKTCGMEKVQTSKGCEKPMLSEKSCCSDEQIIKEGKDDLKISFDTLSFEQQTLIAAFTYSYINLFEGTESEEVPFEDYPRPFVKRDVQVLHQTFLI